MKLKIMKNNKIGLWYSFSFILLMLIVYSCQEDEIIEEVTIENELFLDETYLNIKNQLDYRIEKNDNAPNTLQAKNKKSNFKKTYGKPVFKNAFKIESDFNTLIIPTKNIKNGKIKGWLSGFQLKDAKGKVKTYFKYRFANSNEIAHIDLNLKFLFRKKTKRKTMAKTFSKEDCIDIYDETCVGFDFPNVDEVDYSCSSFYVGTTCTPTPELSNAPDDDNWGDIDGITDDGNLPGSGATGNNNVTCDNGKVFNETTKSCECPVGYVENSNGLCEKPCNNFGNRVKEVLSTEAGFVNDSLDAGGITNRGIAWKTWQASAMSVLGKSPTLDNLKNLSEADAQKIYKKLYWDEIKADKINDGDIRFLLFDFYVNSGPNAIRILQKVLNNMNANINVDSNIGTITINAINDANSMELYNNYKQARLDFLNKIVENNPEQKRFINGWVNRVNKFKNKTSENNKDVNCN